MKVIELDLTNCKTWSDLHGRIRKAFSFPEWCGQNWSAFWDMLWSECDADKLIIKGEGTMPKEFEKELEIMHSILDREVEFRKEYNFPPFSWEVIS